jgi:hypothetical protein
MGNDRQNEKRRTADRAASLASHQALLDTEKKLSEARRLFSLREFLACEELLLQILERDPLNAKARALNELTAIKLHKRKLYKKLVEPRAGRNLHQKSTLEEGEETETSHQPNLSPPADSAPATDPSSFQPQEGNLPETEAPSIDPSASPQKIDTIRERTIAALVQLFKEKDKTLETWRDPRFDSAAKDTEKTEESSSETPSSPPDQGSNGLAIPWQSLENSEEAPRGSQSPSQVDATLHGEDLSAGFCSDSEPQGSAEPNEPAAPAAKVSAVPSLDIVEEIRQLKHEPPAVTETASLPQEEDKSLAPAAVTTPSIVEEKGKKPTRAQEPADTVASKVIRLPQVSPFEQITSPKKVDYKSLVDKKLEERSEDLKNSEIKTVSIAQIKKYLYQEEYELCARELESIQKLFPDSAEIQSLVANTSKRLSELQRVKSFEMLAKELMLSASFHYQQGKLPEALIATNEVLRVIPDHQQARQFAELVQKRLDKEKKKALSVEKIRHCWACGVAVDSVSQYCYHCGHRLA